MGPQEALLNSLLRPLKDWLGSQDAFLGLAGAIIDLGSLEAWLEPLEA